MKKIVTLSTMAATLLVGAPVSAVKADTINKDTKSYNHVINLSDSLFNYFNLPNLSTTNGPIKIDLTKFLSSNGLDMKQLQDSIKQQLAQQGATKPANPGTTTPSAPTKPAKPETPTTKPTVPTTPSKPTTPSTPTKPTTPSTDTSSNTASLSAYEAKVVELTNAERTKAGLKPFTVNATLSKTARLKSQDMTDKNYFDHNSPTYGSPFDMMKQFGITYNYAAENIAKGQKTPEEVVTAWMNSAGHRANILNPNLNQIGVGYDSRSNAWTQQFIGK
ncbi:CAP domain-containing protein [Gottfriedia luciferensis]|uniref:CAP domain-containing protein n=1 Tax=Gottfriedia luciferensis TaxID=178774 RepID=UPI001F36A65D|nr:CAP domain-containing protein [Gottfriedia luciferensis]